VTITFQLLPIAPIQNIWKNRLAKTGRQQEPKTHKVTSVLKVKRDYAKEHHGLMFLISFLAQKV
jgi:hypothetical protein